MATSGTSEFELDVADIIEEAYERLGLEIRSGYDSKSGRRSLNLLLQELNNHQINQWKMALTVVPLIQGQTSYELDPMVMDIKEVVYRQMQPNGGHSDIHMNRVARDAYHQFPNKTTQARSSQFWVERRIPVVVHLYPTPANSSDSIAFYAMERIEDVGAAQNTLNIPRRFLPAIVSGLTYYLSMKIAPERAQMAKAVYDEELTRAIEEDRERTSLYARPFDYVGAV